MQIDETTCFLPTVKGEIGAFGWHIIEDLPATNEATRQVYLNAQGSRHRFHLVSCWCPRLTGSANQLRIHGVEAVCVEREARRFIDNMGCQSYAF